MVSHALCTLRLYRAAMFGAALAVTCLRLAGCAARPEPPVVVGTLERDRLELVAEAAEPVVEVSVHEGDTVAAGQVLLRLDDVWFNAQLAQAQAVGARARARFAELERGPRPERIAEMRAQLAGAEHTLSAQRHEFERWRTLVRSGTETAARLELVEVTYNEAVARRDAAQASLDALLHGTTVEELDQARAAVAEAEAAAVGVRVRLQRLEVRAPRAARVDALPFKVGERPPPGAVVAVLLANGAPYARAFVPETLRIRVHAGASATVRVDGSPHHFAGRVRVVSSEATFTPYFALTERDRSRLSYLAEIDLTDARARDLPSGVAVTVTLHLADDAVEQAGG